MEFLPGGNFSLKDGVRYKNLPFPKSFFGFRKYVILLDTVFTLIFHGATIIWCQGHL